MIVIGVEPILFACRANVLTVIRHDLFCFPKFLYFYDNLDTKILNYLIYCRYTTRALCP